MVKKKKQLGHHVLICHTVTKNMDLKKVIQGDPIRVSKYMRVTEG